MGIGLPMSFGGSGRKEQKKAKVATFKATVQNPGRKKAAKAAPAAEKAEAAFDPSNNPDPWGSDDRYAAATGHAGCPLRAVRSARSDCFSITVASRC